MDFGQFFKKEEKCMKFQLICSALSHKPPPSSRSPVGDKCFCGWGGREGCTNTSNITQATERWRFHFPSHQVAGGVGVSQMNLTWTPQWQALHSNQLLGCGPSHPSSHSSHSQTLVGLDPQRAGQHRSQNCISLTPWYSALQKYSSPLAYFLFCCITTCNW
jgi:hypothetical protein